MGGIFNLDGPFYKFGSMLADIMILSLLWLLFSLPLFTAGAATTALFYVTTRRIANREGYILRDFWNGFKTNFKKATALWLMLLVAMGILIFYFFNLTQVYDAIGGITSYLIPIWIMILVELFFVSIYMFPLTARFDMKLTQIIKSSFFMANRHIFTSVTCVALTLAILMGIYLYPILFLVAMGLYAWLASYLIMRVFKKYRPEMDKDPLEELSEEGAGNGQSA